ncbi:STAS domain-containing protein [Streptomyces sp. NPDC015139]|uniref:STAS domain-containing protein n=1 Tax=Streptomyces sp. NPDC015139 TaxID=3364942 RepID=UPI0036FDCBE9
MPDPRNDPPHSAEQLGVHAEIPSAHTVVLVLTGELDHHTSKRLTQSVDAQLQGPHRVALVLLDLSGLSLVDSTGLTSLLKVRQAVSHTGGEVALIAPSTQVQRMLDITGINQVFSLYPDRHAAIDAHVHQF